MEFGPRILGTAVLLFEELYTKATRIEDELLLVPQNGSETFSS